VRTPAGLLAQLKDFEMDPVSAHYLQFHLRRDHVLLDVVARVLNEY